MSSSIIILLTKMSSLLKQEPIPRGRRKKRQKGGRRTERNLDNIHEKITRPQTQFWVGYLNEIQLRPRFKKSLDLQISLLRGQFKSRIVLSQSTLYALMKLFIVKWCFDRNVSKRKMVLNAVLLNTC